jgi:hypothetical protein
MRRGMRERPDGEEYLERLLLTSYVVISFIYRRCVYSETLNNTARLITLIVLIFYTARPAQAGTTIPQASFIYTSTPAERPNPIKTPHRSSDRLPPEKDKQT